MYRLHKLIIICILGAVSLSGCTALRFTGKTLHTAGRIVLATGKTAGKVAINTAKITGKGIRTVVNMARGREVVKLEKICNSFYVDAILNRRLKTKLILDTGCTETQISPEVARKLGIRAGQGQQVSCQLADGRVVTGRAVNLREVRLGRTKVFNVRTVVLDEDKVGEDVGLLGMSFLDNFVFKIDPEKKELVLQKR